ncbi:hypothetical protein Tco_0944250 [Tanacetum coccineum]
MDSDKYLEGQSMQRPPLFKSDSFLYWKNRFEAYVKSKDLDLWHVITNGDFQPIQNNPETKLDEVVPFEKQNDDLKKRLAKNNEDKMVIYNALPRKEYERIFMKCFIYGDLNHLIGEYPKPPKDKNQRAFVRGYWSDSGEEDDKKAKDKTCLVAHASSKICLGIGLEPDE